MNSLTHCKKCEESLNLVTLPQILSKASKAIQMSREHLITTIVHICVDEINLDQVLFCASFNLLFIRSLSDKWAGRLQYSPERNELALETLKII